MKLGLSAFALVLALTLSTYAKNSGGSGHVSHHDLTITKHNDKSSPKLNSAAKKAKPKNDPFQNSTIKGESMENKHK
jgi:hypothetical protein